MLAPEACTHVTRTLNWRPVLAASRLTLLPDTNPLFDISSIFVKIDK